MTERIFITDIEREKCRKVAYAFRDLEEENIMLVDVGRFGFLRLLYYSYPDGFDDVITYTDSKKLFEDLWNDWLCEQLAKIEKQNPSLMEVDGQDIFDALPEELQKDLISKKQYFAEQAEIDDNF